MNSLLSKITQVSIYLKEESNRINEVTLFQPLQRTSAFNESSKPIAQRKWSYTSSLLLFDRISLRFNRFIFKHLPSCIPHERLTPEAKFKTVLALLLAQESIRDFFLSDKKRRKDFLFEIENAAKKSGYLNFSCIHLANTPENFEIARALTQLGKNKKCLIDNPTELNLQMAAVSDQDRSEILFCILNQVQRPPITSVIEIASHDAIQSIHLTTHYAKYKILSFDAITKKITYSFSDNHTTASILTQSNSLPGAKGVINQKIVFDEQTQTVIGSYSGELSTPFHVLEQILLILGEKGGEAYLENRDDVIEKKILFTSLFSWNEWDRIIEQKASIETWNHKILRCGSNFYQLNLLYFNIPFNALNRYPTPSEMRAKLQDINDEALISLTTQLWKHLGLKNEELEASAKRLETVRNLEGLPFVEKEKARLDEVDGFKQLKRKLAFTLQDVNETIAPVFQALLLGQMPNGKKLVGMDKLLYLNYVTHYLGYFHNKNCQNAIDRVAGGSAGDKAQYAYQQIDHSPFIPGSANEEEEALFKILYSLYLVWEEPEINAALTTGFWGEKFYNNFLQKNPETTRYLMLWLKQHPEIYLGLSKYR